MKFVRITLLPIAFAAAFLFAGATGARADDCQKRIRKGGS